MTQTTFRFSLDRQRPTRLFVCPQCHKRQFKRYVDNLNQGFLGDDVGKCNRENSCGYHLTPQSFFKQNPASITLEVGNALYRPFPTSNVIEPPKSLNFDTIPSDLVQKTLQAYESNYFVQYLQGLFGKSLTSALCKRFLIGTSKHWPGASIFWQYDLSGRFRTGEIKLYNPLTGKRDKTKNQWVHTVLSYTDFKLQQCLFGLHQLLEEPLDKTIGLVESAKTAIVLTAIYPRLIWLATCGAHNLNVERLTPLHGRRIMLFPDTDEKPYTFWQKQKQLLLQKGFQVRLSELLYNRLAPEERSKGYDLADALLNPCPSYGWQLSDTGYPLFWDY